jgi:hypothetical protein
MPEDSTSSLRSNRGRLGAHTSWANTTDRSARTAPARAALDQKFLDQADGDPIRAEHLRKAYFARLALKSAKARRKAKEYIAQAEAVDAELAAGGGDDAAA